VKTRLGYTYVDEWREWLTTLLQQDIANLTIHLRTKKEMSKVPAHFELIDDIIKLRDDIAPQTLLTINGDIRDRTHGEELFAAHPGLNGIMIGRGIFSNPFCFRKGGVSSEIEDKRVIVDGAAPTSEQISDFSEEGADRLVGPASSDLRCPPPRGGGGGGRLDLFDHYQSTLGHPYETLKRFFKIYIRDFDGAKELRDQLMHTKSTDEARLVIANVFNL
jgi:probable tRNA-dihydrouridine synthase 2